MVELIARSLINNLQESSPNHYVKQRHLHWLGRKLYLLTRKNKCINLDINSMFLEDYNEKKRQRIEKHQKPQSNKQFVRTSDFACHRAGRDLKLCLA